MYSNYFIVFDLETGGLTTKGDCSPITEFAACVLNNELEIVAEHDFFIKPYVDESKYSAEALKVSNITLKMCEQEGLDAASAAKKIIEIFKKAKAPAQGKKPVLVGHNIDSFDILLLDYFLTMFKQDLSKVVETAFTIDTKWWGRMAYPDMSGFTLSDCLMRENIDNEQAHRAIGDVRANTQLAIKMLSKIRSQGAQNFPSECQDVRKSFRFQLKKRG